MMKSIKALVFTIFLSLLLGGFLIAYVPNASAVISDAPQNSAGPPTMTSISSHKRKHKRHRRHHRHHRR